MVSLVAIAQAVENGKGFLGGGLAHHHGLEAPLQGRVLLDVLAVFLQGGGADALHLAPGQGGLHDVGSVQAALGLPRAHDGVNFVDEQQDISGLAHFLQHGLHPLLKLAPELASGHHGAHVQAEDALAHQHFGDISLHDALGQALHHGAFAHAGLADEDGVVFGAADQNLDDPLNLLLPADDGIKLVLLGGAGQVAGILLQHLAALAAALGFRSALAWVGALGLTLHAQALDQLLPRQSEVHTQLPQDAGGHAVLLPQQRQPEMLRAHIGLPHAAGFQDAHFQ